MTTALTPDGWLQDGALLYRLTDDRRPSNRDEIRVTMADQSHSPESCARRAGELLDRIRRVAALEAELAACKKDAEFVRSLLWEAHPECCGCPVVGTEYMGAQEMVCCGDPSMDTLNDWQIVNTLRARFPAIDAAVAAQEKA